MVLAFAADTQVFLSPQTGLPGGAFTSPPHPVPTQVHAGHCPGSVPKDLVEHVGHKVFLLIAGQAQQLGPQLSAGPLGLQPGLLVLQPF